MKVVPTDLPGVLVVEPQVHRDERGFLLESYQAARYADAGITAPFVQDNHSRSIKGTLRGLHAQRRRPQCKLIRVLHGEIFDVVVDIRVGSPTFGRWVGITLSAENFRQCYVPRDFAHGFCVVSDWAEVEYKCTDYYDPTDELRVAWNDPELAIRWPIEDVLLSEKDREASTLAVLRPVLPVFEAATP
jgi:dTDP-4-dehydrorhamnose 3,5-epimerase